MVETFQKKVSDTLGVSLPFKDTTVHRWFDSAALIISENSLEASWESLWDRRFYLLKGICRQVILR